jgi:alpha-1,2-mannosyltransferase
METRRAFSGLLPVIAIVVFIAGVGSTLAVAGDTLGYDFRAYYAAASRVLEGQNAYDPGFEVAGPFGLFFYPPTFIPLILPFALLPEPIAVNVWIALMIGASLLAGLAMPVSWRTRWWLLLLAGLSWPFVYNIKLGQVGPLLLLTFALAWRWLDRPWLFGVVAALGGGIKVQPGLLLVWALLTRRWTAVVAGGLTLLLLAAVALPFTGLAAWPDFLAIISRVSDPIASPQNMTPGAVAWQLGAARDVASALQLVTVIAVLSAFVAAAFVLPAEGSFMVAVIATQLLSPILWDHYAVVLLLPTAWLLERRHRWAMLIPLATPVLLVGLLPTVVYPLVFGCALVAVFVIAWRDRDPEMTGRTAGPMERVPSAT